jgi:hypothetical protein
MIKDIGMLLYNYPKITLMYEYYYFLKNLLTIQLVIFLQVTHFRRVGPIPGAQHAFGFDWGVTITHYLI